VTTDVSVDWAPGDDGDQLLNALRDIIQKHYHGDVLAALGGLPVRPKPAPWSTEALLLARVEHRLARMEWTQNGRKGPEPKLLTSADDAAERLRRIGLLPDEDEGTTGVTA